MEIYQVLKADHRVVKAILKQMDDTTERAGKKRTKLLLKLKQELVPHARAEELVVYEPLKESDVKDADDLSFEAYEEHWVSDKLLLELSGTDPADKRWGALLSVLKENLEHHIKEEEEQLFKKCRKSFTDEEAEEMTEKFNVLKKGFLKEVKAGKTPKQPPNHKIEA